MLLVIAIRQPIDQFLLRNRTILSAKHYDSPHAGSQHSRTISTKSVAAEDLHEFGAKHVTKGLGRITQGIMTKGEGSYVYYDDGRKYLDFTCGIGVTNLGERCSKVIILRILRLLAAGALFRMLLELRVTHS